MTVRERLLSYDQTLFQAHNIAAEVRNIIRKEALPQKILKFIWDNGYKLRPEVLEQDEIPTSIRDDILSSCVENRKGAFYQQHLRIFLRKHNPTDQEIITLCQKGLHCITQMECWSMFPKRCQDLGLTHTLIDILSIDNISDHVFEDRIASVIVLVLRTIPDLQFEIFQHIFTVYKDNAFLIYLITPLCRALSIQDQTAELIIDGLELNELRVVLKKSLIKQSFSDYIVALLLLLL
jgi:hypothetical protein